MPGNGKNLFRFDQKLKGSHPPQDREFLLVGIDEAGRGPLAGPVVAGAVCLPPGLFIPGLNDSKQLDPKRRRKIYQKLRRSARWAVGCVQVAEIDALNILRATHAAMRMALANLLRRYPDLRPHLVVIDGLPVPPLGCRQLSIVDGDCKSASIAAASVMAKVVRDRIMTILSRAYPGYGFHKHKGYATREHREKLFRLGPTPAHRKSFFPVSALLEEAASGELF